MFFVVGLGLADLPGGAVNDDLLGCAILGQLDFETRLAMKNLFGLMPGIIYGWPKNVLHSVGIEPSILDIAATVRPDFTIVDGIVGMEGDGPILGDPISSGVIVMGRSAVAVDATCYNSWQS